MQDVECGTLPPHISAVGLFFSLCSPPASLGVLVQWATCTTVHSGPAPGLRCPCSVPGSSLPLLGQGPCSEPNPKYCPPAVNVGLMGVITNDQSCESQLGPQQNPPEA